MEIYVSKTLITFAAGILFVVLAAGVHELLAFIWRKIRGNYFSREMIITKSTIPLGADERLSLYEIRKANERTVRYDKL